MTIVVGYADGKMWVRNIRRSSCPAIGLTTDTRAVYELHPDTPYTGLHCLRDIPDALERRIDFYPELFQCHYILCIQ